MARHPYPMPRDLSPSSHNSPVRTALSSVIRPLHYIMIPQNPLSLWTCYHIQSTYTSVRTTIRRCKGRRSQLEGTNEMSNALARRRRLVGSKPVPTVAS